MESLLTRNDRFFSPRMLGSIAAYLIVAASYLQARLTDDGVIYYDFMRRLVGEDVEAYAYQFGVVFWNLPFYILSRIVRLSNDDDWIEHVLIGAVAVAIASTAAVLALFYVSWRLVRELGLPGGPGAILLTIFGSPLFYYSIFQPGLKHAFDALLVATLALFLLRASRHPGSPRLAVVLGVILAVLISVRYANLMLVLGVLFVFLRQRALTQAYLATATAFVGATVILAVPLALGIPYGLPPAEGSSRPTIAGAAQEPGALLPALTLQRNAAESDPSRPVSVGGGVDNLSSFQIDALAPVKMLFTLKRGLFVWTPLTALGVLGYLLFLRRGRRDRTFLTGLGLSATALLLVHIVWGGYWAGGFSFSQRFLTALFPVFLIGIAELLARTRMLVAPLLVACVAWSAFLALHHFYGYEHVSQEDGVTRIVDLYRGGEENGSSFMQERIRGPIARHWEAYLRWAGLASSADP